MPAARRPGGSAKSLKIVLDVGFESSIEWQASLIESQLEIAVLEGAANRAENKVDENEAKSECLTRF